jgi:hypothetical protein
MQAGAAQLGETVVQLQLFQVLPGTVKAPHKACRAALDVQAISQLLLWPLRHALLASATKAWQKPPADDHMFVARRLQPLLLPRLQPCVLPRSTRSVHLMLLLLLLLLVFPVLTHTHR